MDINTLMKYRNIAKGKFLRENKHRKVSYVEYVGQDENNICFNVVDMEYNSKLISVRKVA